MHICFRPLVFFQNFDRWLISSGLKLRLKSKYDNDTYLTNRATYTN